MSSDAENAFDLRFLSCRPPFNRCFSYSCRQKVVFAASLPCMSVTGILPEFCVSWYVCLCVCCACGGVCVCVREHACICARVCLCFYICVLVLDVWVLQVEQKQLLCQCQVWRMVPQVKDSLFAALGFPLCSQRAKFLYLMLDLCYLSMKLQLRTSYTCGTGWVISSKPACGQQRKWNSFASLLPCIVIRLPPASSFQQALIYQYSCTQSHSTMAIRAISCSASGFLASTKKLKCSFHSDTSKFLTYFRPTSLKLTVASWSGFEEHSCHDDLGG